MWHLSRLHDGTGHREATRVACAKRIGLLQGESEVKQAMVGMVAYTTPAHTALVLEEKGVSGFMEYSWALPGCQFVKGTGMHDAADFSFARSWNHASEAARVAAHLEAEFMAAGQPGGSRPHKTACEAAVGPEAFEAAVPDLAAVRLRVTKAVSACELPTS